MRRTFAEVLRSSGVDVQAEYNSLHSLVFERYGLYTLMGSNFRRVWFASTAVSLNDFNKRHGFDFEAMKLDASLDDLLDFCEYAYNFAEALVEADVSNCSSCLTVINHIDTLIDKMGYVPASDEGLVIFVPRDANVAVAAEVAPGHAAEDLLRYDYRGFAGDIDKKRSMLVGMISLIEPKRKELDRVAKSLSGDLFCLANNFNLRHNNIDPSDKGKYHQYIAEMSDSELEKWYDNCRDLCAASFLLLGFSEQKNELDDIKQRG